MMSKKLYLGIGVLITVILTMAASTFALYVNYNSMGLAGWARQPFPSEHAFNCYQLDPENRTNDYTYIGPCFPLGHPTFQDFIDGPNPPGLFPDGVDIWPGGAIRFTFSLPFSDPEMKWGCYCVCLVLVTTDNMTGLYGPNAPTNIEINVDDVWQYQGTVWSKVPANQQTCHDADNRTVIDFHLNRGHGFGDPYWHNGFWGFFGPTNPWHSIEITNMGPNFIWLDEVHLKSCC